MLEVAHPTQHNSQSDQATTKYSAWDDFDAEAYAWTWYGKEITEIDQGLIGGPIKSLQQIGVRPESLGVAADVGAGPNLYPAMILAPLVQSAGGRIELIELGAANRKYLQNVIDDTDQTQLNGIWNKYEDFMSSLSPTWRGTLARTRQLARVKDGDIYNLRPETYDAASAFFVPESITNSLTECERAIASLLAAVKPGGLVIVGHMLNSEGYPAGAGTHFPGVSITIDDLERFYKGKLKDPMIVEPPYRPQVQKDYHGAAVVVGQKVSS